MTHVFLGFENNNHQPLFLSLFADGDADGQVGFTNAGFAEELSIFCRVADWWAEEHGTWFTEFSNKHCHLWDSETDLQDADDIEW